jgi:hypothetical protein
MVTSGGWVQIGQRIIPLLFAVFLQEFVCVSEPSVHPGSLLLIGELLGHTSPSATM